MNREQRRLSEKIGRQKQKKEWDEFKDVTYEALLKNKALNGCVSKNFPNAVFMNNKFIVQIFFDVVKDGCYYKKLMIRRSDSEPITGFHTLQRIKNEVLGPEVEAIQFFPRESELTDVANLYWLWVEEI